jgi:hypothetical protein
MSDVDMPARSLAPTKANVSAATRPARRIRSISGGLKMVMATALLCGWRAGIVQYRFDLAGALALRRGRTAHSDG